MSGSAASAAYRQAVAGPSASRQPCASAPWSPRTRWVWMPCTGMSTTASARRGAPAAARPPPPGRAAGRRSAVVAGPRPRGPSRATRGTRRAGGARHPACPTPGKSRKWVPTGDTAVQPCWTRPGDVARTAPAEVRRPRRAVAVEVVLRLHRARLSAAGPGPSGVHGGHPASVRLSPMSYDDVWLVIPLYNEETVIGDVVRDARPPSRTSSASTTAPPTAAPTRRRPPVPWSSATRSTSGRAPRCRPGSSTPCRCRRCGGSSPSTPTASTRSPTCVAMLDKARAEDLQVVFGVAVPRRPHRGRAC